MKRGNRLPVRHVRVRGCTHALGAGDDQLRNHQRACRPIRRARWCREQA